VLPHQDKKATRVGVFKVARFERELPHGSGNGLFGEAPHPGGAALKGVWRR
jgi:hypothetical protein